MDKIRSERSPLIMGLREWAELWLIGREFKQFWGFGFLGESFQKGYTRKLTGKRVTRWRKVFWRNLAILR
jgi:hypothetical protein